MYKLIIAIAITASAVSYCDKGCLKCTSNNECLYCDTSDAYRLVDGRCFYHAIDNCLQVDEKGRCLLCAEGYYVDPGSFTCVYLEPSLTVQNCARHAGPASCTYCATGYVLKNLTCEAASNIIPFCSIQDSKGRCLICNNRYIRTANRERCVAIPDADNCATYSNLSCRRCNSGTLYNPNRYINVIFGFKGAEQTRKLNRYINDQIAGALDDSVFRVCESTTLQNCLKYLDVDRCASCEEGYNLDYQGKCAPNPLPVILNCDKYASASMCVSCKQGYYLKSATNCVPVIRIDNCLLYRADIDFVACRKCSERFFLSPERVCKIRTELSLIEYCMILDDNSEHCTKCLENYKLTDDKFGCLPFVENCDIYARSTLNSLRHKCDTCADGFYLNPTYKVCSKGSVSNCQKYAKTSNDCILCEANFYLVSNNCLPHIQLPSCEIYSPKDEDTCLTCKPFTFLFAVKNACTRVFSIKHCHSYASKTTCGTCKEGFYLANPSMCVAIPPDLNCLRLNADFSCSKCMVGYALESGKCFMPGDYMLEGCQKSNTDGMTALSNVKCSHCRPNYVPLNFKNTFVCQAKTDVRRRYLSPSAQLDDNCLQFMLNAVTQILECVKCGAQMVLEGSTCVNSCTKSTRMTIYKQYVEVNDYNGDKFSDAMKVVKTLFCGPTIENCAVAAPNISSDFKNVIYSCVECLPGFFKAVSIGGPTAIYTRPGERIDLPNNQYGTSPLTIAPGVQCLKTGSVIKVLGETSSQEVITGCDYFQVVFNNLYGCAKCKWGATGVVVDLIKNCSVVTDYQTCSRCEAGYFLKTPKECSPVIDIINCIVYNGTASSSVCTLCSSEYYLSSNTCLKRVNSLNVPYSAASVTADTVTCNNGYILDTAVTPYVCKKLPYNCITATIVPPVVTCTECKRDVGYLSAGSCIDGTITGCQQYAIGSNECDICSNGMYKVSATLCLPHDTVNDTQCSVWDQTTKNLCGVCKPNALRFEIKNRCLSAYIPVTNCKEYLNIYKCKTCDTGYYLDNLSRTCRQIPSDSLCEAMTPIDVDSNGVLNEGDLTTNKRFVYTCDKCKASYYRHQTTQTVSLLSGGTASIPTYDCYDYFEFIRSRCIETAIDGIVDLGGKYCLGCTLNYFPYNFNNKFTCVERKYIAYKSSSFDPNCEIVSYDVGNNFKCLRCKFGFFLKNNNNGTYSNECVSTCNNLVAAPLDYVVPYLYYFEHVSTAVVFETGVCKDGGDSVSSNIGAAYQRGIKLSDNTLMTVISKCKDDYIPVLDYDNTHYYRTFINPNGSSFRMNSPFEGYEALADCVDQSSNALRGFVGVSGWIDNCEFYHELDANLYGCMKCKFGYTGRIKGYTSATEVNYGSIEYCDVMPGCDTNMTAGSFDTISAAQDNGLINRYFSCYKCLDSGANAQVVVAAVAASSGIGTPTNDFAAIYGLREYHLTTSSNSQAYTVNVTSLNSSYSNFCTPVSTLATALGLDNTTLVVTNCAAYYLNVDSKGLSSDVSLVCSACLPGYLPTYDSTLKFRVTACTLTPNCSSPATGSTFNKCMNCVFFYSIYTDFVHYDTCLDLTGGSIDAVSCYSGFDKDNCSLCRPGYEIDKSVAGKATCYKLTVNGCTEVNFYNDFMSNYALVTKVRDTGLYLYMGISSSFAPLGCTKCSSSTDVMLVNNSTSNSDLDPRICVLGSDSRQTDTVANCTRIGYDYDLSKYVCRQCTTSYVRTVSNSCIPEDAVKMPNCILARDENGDYCIQCSANNFLIVGGICLDTTAVLLPRGLVQRCIAYTANTKDLAEGACERCETGYYVDAANTCQPIPLPECADYNPALGCTACNGKQALLKLSGRNVCVPLDLNSDSNWDYDTNCEQILVDDADPAVDDLQTKYLVCNKCKAHSVLSFASPDLPMRSECVNIALVSDPLCSVYDIQQFLINSTFTCTQCSNYTTHYFNPATKFCTARTVIANCTTYDPNADLCVACVDNFTPNYEHTACLSMVADVGLRALNRGYIHTCRDMPRCNNNVFYEGLEADLMTYFSCHVCKKAGDIPFIAARTDMLENRIESLNEYGFNGLSSQPLNKASGGMAVECLKPVFSTFNVGSGSNFVFPDNCGLGLIKTNLVPNSLKSSSSSTDIDKSTIMCVACKPGFKAAPATKALDGSQVRYMISSCTAITNCQYSRWFSACTHCNPGYSFSYSLTTGVKYSVCESYAQNPLCHSVYTLGNTSTCMVCKKGSHLNKDGICDLINPPRCEYGAFAFNQPFRSKDLAEGLFSINDGVGCKRCEEGFVGVFISTDNYACTESQYLIGAALPANTKYANNCLNYALDEFGNPACAVCAEDFVPTAVGKCVPKTKISNCKLAQTDSLCNICREGYVLVNRVCEAEKITNCIKYVYSINAASQTCLRCGPEFFLSANKCVQGAVRNCKVLTSPSQCFECKDNYTLVSIKGHVSFCYPNSPRLNCKRFNPKKLSASILECDECSTTEFVLSSSRSDFKPTFCMPFTDVEKCVKFDNTSRVSESGFNCLKCDQAYYLKEGQCIKRTVEPSQCTVYSDTNDRCVECTYGFFPNAIGAKCVTYPEGIYGCRRYQFKSKCEACVTDMYLKDNQCHLVTAPIPFCVYYDDHDVCNTCTAGYVLTRGVCKAAKVKSCLTYASLTECKTCAEGFGLKKDEDLIDCVVKNVANCAKSEDVEPYKCLTCNKGHYPLDGICVATSTPIVNCLIQDTSTTCTKCDVRTALGADRKSCDNNPGVVAQIDPNCDDAVLLDTPACNTCKAGYYFRFGKCTACSAQTLAKGCYMCSPDAPEICLLCGSGYHMNAEGDCDANEVKPKSNSVFIFGKIVSDIRPINK